jgi:hypothetical protein
MILENPTAFFTFSNIINIIGPAAIFKGLFMNINDAQRRAFLTD